MLEYIRDQIIIQQCNISEGMDSCQRMVKMRVRKTYYVNISRSYIDYKAVQHIITAKKPPGRI